MQVTGRDNNMKIGFESMPGIAEALLENLSEKKLSEAVPDELVQGLERVVVTGCGDSYAATLATKELNERMFAGCDYHALRTIDVSRHFVFPQWAPEKTLVMVISVSGGGARVTEAMMRAAKAGCTTLGITAHPESRMGVQAQYILQLEIPQLPVSSIASQTRNYLAALMTTLLMGLHAGRVRGVISERQVEERRAEILRYVRAVCDPGVLDRVDDQMLRLASAGWKDYLGYDFVGAGSDFATAYFGTAKFFEYYGALSCLNDSEDWCHINYFMRDRRPHRQYRGGVPKFRLVQPLSGDHSLHAKIRPQRAGRHRRRAGGLYRGRDGLPSSGHGLCIYQPADELYPAVHAGQLYRSAQQL